MMHVEGVAAMIARELFSLGDEPGSPTQRIEFRGGFWSLNRETERAQGGLNEDAFATWLGKALARHNACFCHHPALDRRGVLEEG